MFRAIAFAAALTTLPFSAAHAQDPVEDASARLEAAAEAFGARMEEFGARAEAVGEDETLTEEQRELRIAAIYAEYEPDVLAFSTLAGQHAAEIAALAIAEADIEAEVARAIDAAAIEEEISAAFAGGGAIGTTGGIDHPGWVDGGAATEGQIAQAVVNTIANIDFASMIEAALAQADIEGAVADALSNMDAEQLQTLADAQAETDADE